MKRDKTGIWRGVLSAVIVLLSALALSSCTKEPIGPSMPDGDGIQVRVSFPQSETTRALTKGTDNGTDKENQLDRVTILVFNGDGSKLETVFSEDVRPSNTSLPTTQPKWEIYHTLIVRSVIIDIISPKKIYAIANWNKVDFDKTTYTETMLQDEITTIASVASINNAAAYPMLMSGSIYVPNLTSLLYNVTVDMARQSSKIKAQLTIPKDVQDYQRHIEWQTDLMKITVANVPNNSYIVGRSAIPTGSTPLNSDPIAVDDTKPATGDQTFPATKELKWSESVYITENPVEGATQAAKDASTYIIVQLPYKNKITNVIEPDNYYKVHINDPGDATSPHKVLRNTIYNFNISIKGMGLPINNLIPNVNIDDQLTVIPWEEQNIDVDDTPQKFFNIDRTLLTFQYMTEDQKVNLVTDVEDWKLIDKANGNTLLLSTDAVSGKSFEKDGIKYTLSGTATQATITATKLRDEAPTIPKQELTFVARNIKIPFTVVYDNGFIPNSVLVQSFTVNGKTYQGWPADRLPTKGLQITKRGNVLPSGVLKDEELRCQWSLVREDTGTRVPVGAGKGNYAILSVKDPINYPIGQACKHLGPEWYVPSVGELVLIYNNQSTFGTSYPFGELLYLCSTESTSADTRYVDFINGYAGTCGKGYGCMSRCVREI